VCAWGREAGAILKSLVERSLVPSRDFHRVEVKNCGEGVELMEGRNNIPVVNIRKPADVQDELGPPAFYGNFVTSFLYITIGQAEGFAGLA